MISEGDSKRLDIVRVFGSYSLQKIINDKPPTIGELKKQHGSEKIETALAIVVHDLGLSFDGEITKEHALEIAAEISSTILRNITLEGVFVTCQEIKRSDVFGKLNINKVLKAMHRHLEEQCEAISSKNYNNHLAQKFNTDSERSSTKREERIREQQHDYELDKLKNAKH